MNSIALNGLRLIAEHKVQNLLPTNETATERREFDSDTDQQVNKQSEDSTRTKWIFRPSIPTTDNLGEGLANGRPLMNVPFP